MRQLLLLVRARDHHELTLTRSHIGHAVEDLDHGADKLPVDDVTGWMGTDAAMPVPT